MPRTRRCSALAILAAALGGPTCAPHEPAQEPVAICPAGTALIAGGRAGGLEVSGFCLDVEEVSTAAYATCVDAGSCSPAVDGDVEACNITRGDRGAQPINCVDLGQAQAYCAWLGKRLPTVGEWTWAARGGERRLDYPWGAAPPDPSRACLGRRADKMAKGTCQIGAHPAGASAEGVVDLVGNVAEWVRGADAAGMSVGQSWATPRPTAEAALELLPRADDGAAVSAAERGFRCAVAPRTPVQTVEIGDWRPHKAPGRELPELAELPSTPAPTRPLANLAILARDDHEGGGATYWPVGDRYVALEPAAAAGLGLGDPVDLGALPAALRGLRAEAPLGGMALLSSGWSANRSFVALERQTTTVAWQRSLSDLGPSYVDFVGPRTLVVGLYGEGADSLVGFALDDGAEVWRMDGAVDGDLQRVRGLWTDGERGYVTGDRGLVVFDPTDGAILWTDGGVGQGCGVITGEGLVVVEEAARFRVLDAPTGAAVSEVARPGGGGPCRWEVSAYDGGVAPGALAGGVLFLVEPTKTGRGDDVAVKEAAIYAVEIEGGAVKWRRAGFDGRTLLADHDAVYASRAEEWLVAVDAATGEPRVEVSFASSFTAEVVAAGGEAGPLVIVDAEQSGTWVLGRGPEPVPPERFTIRGRVVPDEGVPKRRAVGARVRIGERWVRTSAGGRLLGKGRGLGAIAVAPRSDEALYEAAEHSWGPFFTFTPSYVVLDGSGTYDVGDLTLFRWYSE